MRKATFSAFREVIEIIVNTDLLSREDYIEYLNEWFELYKDTNYFDVIEWAQFHFAEVTQDSHDFWLDKRGLMLYRLQGMIMQTGQFPIV